MATIDDDLSKEVQTLKQDLASLRGDIGSLAEAVKSAGEQKGEAVYQRAREKSEELRAQGQSTIEQVGHKVDERPMTSVLTAFGTGLLVGLLLNQRRH